MEKRIFLVPVISNSVILLHNLLAVYLKKIGIINLRVTRYQRNYHFLLKYHETSK